jgi:hypothetical protein
MLSLAACGSSKASSSSSHNATGNTPTGPTLPAPAAVTGTLSGPGVTPTTITLGQITTISGPVPGLFQGANDGLNAWAAYINAHGGLDGRQVKILHSDDGLNCNAYTSAIKQYAGKVFAMIGTFTLEDTCGKSTLQSNPSLPDIQAATLDPTLYSIPNVYAPSPNPPWVRNDGIPILQEPVSQRHHPHRGACGCSGRGQWEGRSAGCGVDRLQVRLLPPDQSH